MSLNSAIEWTDATWNPVTGCSKVSAGCTNCYAERLSHRFGWTGKPWNAAYAAENVRLHPERLEQPLHWQKPRKVFVNSMSDLFHEQVPNEFLERVFTVMFQCPQHTFQVLTKRPRRMYEFISGMVEDGHWGEMPKHIWLGVSVENQQAADERIPLLLQTPAAVRFLSCEPLLGPLDLSPWLNPEKLCEHCDAPCDCPLGKAVFVQEDFDETSGNHPARCVNWVIVGGESGPNARPMHPEWVRSLRDQCQEAGVPFFFKQWGEWFPRDQWEDNPDLILPDDDVAYTEGPRTHVFEEYGEVYPVHRVGKKAAGRMLDGRTWDEYPDVGREA